MHDAFKPGAARISMQRLQNAVTEAKASTRYYWLRDRCTADQARVLLSLATKALQQPDRAQLLDEAIDQMISEEITRGLSALPAVTESHRAFLHSV